jgi:beta-galactosidase
VAPQYDLAWRRFQARLVTDYIGWQARLVRELIGPDPFVTTCISYEQLGIEDVELSAHLDIAAGNAYYEMEDSLAHPSDAPRSTGALGWIVRGAWGLTQLADLMYSSKQAPFLVTETNAGSIGLSMVNQTPYEGQWRQAAWMLVARGARMIEYWHWNTLPYGAETHWGGVLPHSGQPGRAYREIARLGGELGLAGAAFADAEPDFDVAVLYDSESKWALSGQPPLTLPNGFVDTDFYRSLVAAFTRGIFDAKRQARLVRPQHLLPSRGGRLSPAAVAARFPVLLVPSLMVATDADLDHLAAYAQAGGHLVLGPRSGTTDEEARVRTDRLPSRLADLAGVWHEESANPGSPVQLETTGILSGHGVGLLEGLSPESAEVLARYVHPHYGRWAAVTTNPVGDGRITVVGTLPDQDLARTLALWLAPEAVGGWQGLPESATVSSSTAADGSTVHIVHNWGWESSFATAPTSLTDLLGGESIAAGGEVRLGPWDVRVLRSGT